MHSALGGPIQLVGLDTASNRWHAVDHEYKAHFCSELKGVAWKTDGEVDPDKRRHELVRTWVEFVMTLDEDSVIYCEEPLALQNGKSTRLLSLTGGALWAATLIVRPDIRWEWVDVAHWKRVIVGNGNADKDAIRLYMLAFLKDPDGRWDEEPDLYDAACLLQFGVQWYTQGVKPAILEKKPRKPRRKKAS